MPAHIVYPKIDQHCAGFSRVWIQELLRKELGFDGVVFSDDLTMRRGAQRRLCGPARRSGIGGGLRYGVGLQ